MAAAPPRKAGRSSSPPQRSSVSFGRQKKQKRQGEFSEFPPAPQNSSYPHKQTIKKSGIRPLIKGGKRNRRQADKRKINRRTTKDRQTANILRKAINGRSYAIKARSRGLLRACCYFEFLVVVKGAKNFAALSRRLALALHHARQLVINVPLQRGGVGV